MNYKNINFKSKSFCPLAQENVKAWEIGDEDVASELNMSWKDAINDLKQNQNYPFILYFKYNKLKVLIPRTDALRIHKLQQI